MNRTYEHDRGRAVALVGGLVALVVAAGFVPPAADALPGGKLPVGGTYVPDGAPRWDTAGNMYFSASIVLTKGPVSPSQVVMKRDKRRKLTVVAGDGRKQGRPKPGRATRARFGTIDGIAVDRKGNLFISDCASNVVVKVTGKGRLSIVAGRVGKRGRPKPGQAKNSRLDCPSDLAVDSTGNLYINDHGNKVIEKVTPGGTLSIVVGKVRKQGFPADGRATDSRMRNVSGLALDRVGNLYVSEAYPHNVVSKVTPAGRLSRIAGRGGYGRPRAGLATDVYLGVANDVAVDRAGDVYVAMTSSIFRGNFSVIGKVARDGKLSIVAGKLDATGKPRTGKATASKLGTLLDISVDKANSVFVNTGVVSGPDHYIVKVTPKGRLSFVESPFRTARVGVRDAHRGYWGREPREEDQMAKDHGSSVKNDKQYEGLRKKGMSKERAAKIANTPNASKKGGKKS